MIKQRLKDDYIEWQISRRLPTWAFVLMVLYWFLVGFGLIERVAL